LREIRRPSVGNSDERDPRHIPIFVTQGVIDTRRKEGAETGRMTRQQECAMKTRVACAIVVSIVASAAASVAFAADVGAAPPEGSWMVRNISRHTGISPEEVVAVLGKNIKRAECAYEMQLSRRAEIRHLVVQGRDEMYAAKLQQGLDAKSPAARTEVAAVDR
jgi:hypothetical protein